MIPEHMEPSGLAPDVEPIADFWTEADRREDAITGSEMLRDATLRALGRISTPPRPDPIPHFRKPKRKGPGRPRNSRKVRRVNYHIIRIMDATAAHFRVSVERLVEPDRSWRAVEPRQVAIYLARNRTVASYPDIGLHFGGRDHTTIIYSERQVEKRIAAVDTRTIKALHEINKKLSGRRG